MKDTGNVQISKHAYDRLEQRSGVQAIFAEDVYDILETGAVQSAPILEDGEWKVIVVKRMPGSRDAGAVTLFVQENETLFVKTVQWMDWMK